MSALVNYAAGEIAPTAMDIGVAIGKHLGAAALKKGKEWASKPRPVKAGRTAKKGKPSVTMKKVGDDVGTSLCKWGQLKQLPTNTNPETLYQTSLLNISRTTVAGSDYNTRETDQVNFRGIKFCLSFRVENAIGTAQAWMNVAIISPKGNLPSTSTIPLTEFFRNPNGTQRDIDFNDPSQDNLDYRCNAINSDKYTIHKRMTITMGPTQSTEGLKDKYVEFYLPVGRQIRYNHTGTNPEGKNMYMVWWYSTSDNGTPAAAVKVQYKIMRYFREPQLVFKY